MGPTKDHLIFDLLAIARAGKIADDEMLTPELVGFWVDNTRARLVKQEVDKGKSINPDIIQTISCMDVSQVDSSECPGCEETGCFILRTDEQLPTTIESRGRNLITRIGPINTGGPGFSIIPYERSFWSGHNKFTKGMVRAYLRNRYVYIITDKFLRKISVSGVFSYPEELGNYVSCIGEACYSKSSYYPVSSYMIEDMKRMIIDTNFRLALSVYTDSINNANGEIMVRQPRSNSKDSENS